MSKWVKRNLGRGKFALDNDPNTRQAIAQQLKIGDELRKKMHSVDGADNSVRLFCARWPGVRVRLCR